MKHNIKITLLLCLVLVAALATSAFTASGPQEDKVVFGGTFVLSSGETLNGNLVVLGGAVTLEQNSTVTGDTVLIGGTLDADGNITGTLAIVGGSAHLGDKAVVNRDVVSVGGSLTRASGSQIKGEVMNFAHAPLSLTIPGMPGEQLVPVVPVYETASLMWKVIYFLGVVVFTSALAMLIALLWSKPTQRVANAITVNPIGTGGFGCLTLIVTPGLLVLVAITIILSPLSLLGFLLLLAAILFGWTAINLEVGNRLAKLFKVNWSAPIAAGIGALVFNFVVFGLGWIPCFGWALVTLVVLFALGGVLTTRFGTHDYPEAPDSRPLPMKPVEPGTPYAPAITSQPIPFYPEVTK
ncbi:MAG: hypothetical protein WCF08_06145, partial [Anaerolineaceae bacterium]